MRGLPRPERLSRAVYLPDTGRYTAHVARIDDPKRAELMAAARWCRTHDPSPGFGAMLVQLLASFGTEVTLEDLA